MIEQAPQQEHFPTINKLHSDVLEAKFGPIHSELIEHNESYREAMLVDEGGVARTYALTFFPKKKDPVLADIEEQIKQGGMIGKSFRDKGYEIRKNVIDVMVLDLPQWLQDKFQTEVGKAKARLSEFYAKRHGSSPVIYGTVLEVYTPDFRAPRINDVDLKQINPATEKFKSEGIGMEDIWSRLDKASEDSEWDDQKESFRQALKATQPLLVKLRQEIKDHFRARD